MLRDDLIDKLYTFKDVKTEDLSDLPPLLAERVAKSFLDPEYAVWIKRPVEGAQYLLKCLELNNILIGIVTARPFELYEITKDYLAARFPGIKFEQIVFVTKDIGPSCVGLSKRTYFDVLHNNYDIITYADDNSVFCEEMVDSAIEKSKQVSVFLVGNRHKTVYNQIRRVKSVCSIDPIFFHIGGVLYANR